jgi:Dolichyl-phosphate-mannose-protein mannosyltransferase
VAASGVRLRAANPAEGAPSRSISWNGFAPEALTADPGGHHPAQAAQAARTGTSEPGAPPDHHGLAPAGPPAAQIAAGRSTAALAAAVRRWPRARRAGQLLPAVLALQAALSLRLVWSNGAYQDEALYLWAGRLEIARWTHGTPVPGFQAYFSGSPVIYPPIAALAGDIGGLAGARILSLIFMLGATGLLYATTARLLGSRFAIAAATLFATFGLGVELGALATYDAMAVFLTALAAYLAVRAGTRLRGEPLLAAAGCVLGAAAATKYAAGLWAPVIICLAALTGPPGPWLRRALRAGRLICYATVPVIVALMAGGARYLQGIEFSTLHRQIVTGTPALRVLDIAWGWLALLLLLGLLGTVLIWYDHRHIEILPLVLLAAASLAPVAQACIHDVTSLHKQVVFGAWFLCVVAGYAVARIAFLDGRLSQGAVISVTLATVFAGVGYVQASALHASWPSVAPAMPSLARAITADGCPCLISQESDARYYLPAADLTGLIVGPYSFTYQDAATPVALSGPRAMATAIGNGYFGAVEIDGLRTPAVYQLLRNSLRQSGQYRLVYAGYWSGRPHEPTQVWQRTGIAGAHELTG